MPVLTSVPLVRRYTADGGVAGSGEARGRVARRTLVRVPASAPTVAPPLPKAMAPEGVGCREVAQIAAAATPVPMRLVTGAPDHEPRAVDFDRAAEATVVPVAVVPRAVAGLDPDDPGTDRGGPGVGVGAREDAGAGAGLGERRAGPVGEHP